MVEVGEKGAGGAQRSRAAGVGRRRAVLGRGVRGTSPARTAPADAPGAGRSAHPRGRRRLGRDPAGPPRGAGREPGGRCRHRTRLGPVAVLAPAGPGGHHDLVGAARGRPGSAGGTPTGGAAAAAAAAPRVAGAVRTRRSADRPTPRFLRTEWARLAAVPARVSRFSPDLVAGLPEPAR